MFERLGHAVFRLRFAIVVAWVLGAAACVAFAPSLADVGSADQSSFLPPNAESSTATSVLERAFPREAGAGSATVAFSRDGGMTEADHNAIADLATWITDASPAELRDVVKSVTSAEAQPEIATRLRSQDGSVELLQVDLSVSAFDQRAGPAAAALRDRLATALPAGLTGHVTGSVGIASDYLAAILQATDRTTVVTVILVVFVLLLIYRAPLAALVPLLTIAAAYLVGRGVLGYLGQAGWKISSLLETFVVVLVFGVGTDYTIFLISRFREEVGGTRWRTAVGTTVRRIGAVITASAATVAIGLGSMVVGQFGMFQTTGPALAIVILVTLAAGLTLAPALLGIFGHHLFWPLREERLRGDPERGVFGRLARMTSRRPLAVAAIVLVALGAPAIASSGLHQTFDVLADLPPSSDAKAGFDVVADHFDKGQLLPVMVVIDGGTGSDLGSPASLSVLRATTQRVLAVEGITRVESLIAPTGDGTTPDGFRPSIQLTSMAKQFVVPTDPAAGLKKLLDPDTTTGLHSASEYLGALGGSFADVATQSDFQQARADLERMPAAIAALRERLTVSNQLTRLAGALQAAAAAGIPVDRWLPQLTAYVNDLAAAYPQIKAVPAFRDLAARLVSSATPPDPGAIAADVADMATTFASTPDAILVPSGAAADSETSAIQAEIATIGVRLPVELTSLSATFAARADDLFIPTGLSGEGQASIDQTRAAYLSGDGSVTRLYAVTADDPYSTAAFDTVARIRGDLAGTAIGYGQVARILVGGQSALERDLQDTIATDFVRVAALTVIGVLLVLMLLLRSVVAPLYLVGTVLLSYLATLGLGSLFFQDVLGQAGMNYFLPLMVFVLLVALGSDYNIFLMSRVREESAARGTTDGIRIASARTGAVITSAGIILAGTFLAMVASPLTVLFQVGIMVAVGVLIDTFIVRSLLVPAITTILGERAWWPFEHHDAPPAPHAPTPPEPTPPEVRPVGHLPGAQPGRP
ncbi:MAG: MMPL family transporter [Chloroflexi bacterium]|nr:MMPL family transporter [Chloroflexota bacterium]